MLLAPWSPSAEIPATTNQVFLKSPLNMFVFSKHRKQQRSLAARGLHQEERGRAHPSPLSSLLLQDLVFCPEPLIAVCVISFIRSGTWMVRFDPYLWGGGQ